MKKEFIKSGIYHSFIIIHTCKCIWSAYQLDGSTIQYTVKIASLVAAIIKFLLDKKFFYFFKLTALGFSILNQITLFHINVSKL